jgi:hypothetical protein
MNVFICHNPFHVYMSTQICKSHFMSPGFENLIISSVDGFTRLPGVTYQVRVKGFWGMIASLRKARRTIDTLVRDFKNVQFFVPHIEGVLSNYIYRRVTSRVNYVNINFYYEGAVMVDVRRGERDIVRFTSKKQIFGLFIFYWFVSYPDMLPMRSQKVNRVYTPYPDLTDAPDEKKVIISFPREKISTTEESVLIVGIDVGDGLEEATNGLIDFIEKNSTYRNFYFKPHYADQQHLFERLAEKKNFQYTLVNEKGCIEEIIGGLNVGTVVCTHCSSALLNLKLIYKDDMKVLFLAQNRTLRDLGDEFVALIRLIGIEIINMD